MVEHTCNPSTWEGVAGGSDQITQHETVSQNIKINKCNLRFCYSFYDVEDPTQGFVHGRHILYN